MRGPLLDQRHDRVPVREPQILQEDPAAVHRGGGLHDRRGLHEPGDHGLPEARAVQHHQRPVRAGEHHREGARQQDGAVKTGAGNIPRMRPGRKTVPSHSAAGAREPAGLRAGDAGYPKYQLINVNTRISIFINPCADLQSLHHIFLLIENE